MTDAPTHAAPDLHAPAGAPAGAAERTPPPVAPTTPTNTRTFAWAGWTATITLILLVLAARVAYLVWLCPYTLAEDEAQYWEWARRLDLSYYTKGPGVAWSIWVSTHLFGLSEWAIRIPAALASALTTLALAALAADVARDRRAAFFAAAIVSLTPIYQGIAQFMTIDSPYLALWSWSAFFGWRAISRRSGPAWVACGACLGVGFLFKYTILLLPVGLGLALLLSKPWRPAPTTATTPAHDPPLAQPRHEPRSAPGLFRERRLSHWLLAALAVFILTASPVIVWNTLRGWPTISHLFVHLNKAQDHAPAAKAPYNPLWTLEFIGQQFVLGPVIGLLIAGTALALRSRRREPDLWPGRRCLLLCAAPILLFYLLVTLRTDAQGNWTLAGYATLIALAATFFVPEMDRYAALVRSWLALPAERRPRAGLFRRKPETLFQVSWHWSLGAGVITALVLARADLLARLPVLGTIIPAHRILAAQQRADDLQSVRMRVRNETGADPFIAAQYYGVSAQSAFYLPDRPVTYCARHKLGAEVSQYDFFPDTNLDSTALLGRDAVLIGGREPAFWAAAFDRVEAAGSLDLQDRARFDAGMPPVKDGKFRVYIGRSYHGWPAANTPTTPTAP